MEVYLIRHTRVGVDAATCYGRADVPLADTAAADQAAVLAKLGPLPGAAVYSSPATRCRALAAGFGTDVRLDARLQELDFGTWELLPWESIPAAELNPWMADFVHVAPPGGESFVQMQARCLAFWHDLQAAAPARAVVVAHAGVVRSLLCHCLGIPLPNAFRLAVDSGSVTRLDGPMPGGAFTVAYTNR